MKRKLTPVKVFTRFTKIKLERRKEPDAFLTRKSDYKVIKKRDKKQEMKNMIKKQKLYCKKLLF